MAIKDNITVIAGSKIPKIDVETTTIIKHATTGKVYAGEKEAEEDIKRDVAIQVNKLPDIFGGSS